MAYKLISNNSINRKSFFESFTQVSIYSTNFLSTLNILAISKLAIFEAMPKFNQNRYF